MTQPLETSRIAAEVVDAILSGQSRTIARTGPLPDTGYYVGGKVPSLVIDPLATPWTIESVVAWVESHRSDYVGVWLEHDTGLFHVDMSDWVVNRSYALGLAKRRGELAIYDIRHASDIRVEA